MPDSVIVTVLYNETSGDYSLPFQQPIRQWIAGLQAALLAPALRLLQDGQELDSQYSLQQYNVLDGAVLTALPA